MDMAIPWQVLAEARTPDGNLMTLTRRGRDYLISAGGKPLMGSGMKGSEEALSTLGCVRSKLLEDARVLVGGLGMGFTLRAALDVSPPEATVVVAELMPAVVEWNRGELGALAGHPLSDKRTRVALGDVAETMRQAPQGFDAILLDVDNGPTAFTTEGNNDLYGNAGILNAKAALRPHGVLAVWSAWDDRKFEHRMRHHGFKLEVHHVRARGAAGGKMHTIFVGYL